MLCQHPPPVHPGAQTALAAVQEVEAVVLDVEANQVAVQDALRRVKVGPNLVSNFSPVFLASGLPCSDTRGGQY